MTKKKLEWLFAGAVLSALMFQCLYFASENGQTVDETFYNGSGYAMVRYNDYRILGEHPPLLMQLGSLPLLFFQPKFPINNPIHLSDDANLFDISKMGSRFLYEMGNDPYKILFTERCVIIFVTLLLGLILFAWARSLYGLEGASVSLVLYAFCPDVIAHGSLFTTDMGAAAFIFISIYCVWRFFQTLAVRNAVLAGALCGLALMSKISAFILFPVTLGMFISAACLKKQGGDSPGLSKKNETRILILCVLLFILATSQKTILSLIGPLTLVFAQLVLPSRFPAIQKWIRMILAAGWLGCVAALIAALKKNGLLVSSGLGGWCLANLIIAFVLARRPRHDYAAFLAKMFILMWLVAMLAIVFIYTDFPFTAARFKPFHHYINTFNIAASHAQTMHKLCVSNPLIFCDWRYFLGVMAVKTPAVTLALFFLGLPLFCLSKIPRMTKICILWPPFAFWFVASFLNKINIGLRHVLPLYPFIFLIAGGTGYAISRMSKLRMKNLLGSLLVFALVYFTYNSTAHLPHQLSYFNEFIGSVENGAKYTTDSNVNWGQDNKRLAEWVTRHKVTGIKIASKTANAPEFTYHKINWQPMSRNDFEHPSPGWYALDIETYQAEQGSGASGFKDKRPFLRIGQTFFIFKIS